MTDEQARPESPTRSGYGPAVDAALDAEAREEAERERMRAELAEFAVEQPHVATVIALGRIEAALAGVFAQLGEMAAMQRHLLGVDAVQRDRSAGR